VRCALLAAAEDRRTSADLEQAGALRFCCALAAQCWINEYVFDVTDDESARVTALAERVTSALRADEAVAMLPLVLVASYRPLHTVITPEMLDRPWPEPVAGIVRQQVHEPLEERQLAASLPQLTEIDDEVSRRVREQYEQNPYPRWVKLEPPREPTTLEYWLRQTLPSATLAPLSARNGIDILVAGCGSGQNPITAARTFAGARVLAADLSLASLAHAQRALSSPHATMAARRRRFGAAARMSSPQATRCWRMSRSIRTSSAQASAATSSSTSRSIASCCRRSRLSSPRTTCASSVS
jgi:hypothetical protein